MSTVRTQHSIPLIQRATKVCSTYRMRYVVLFLFVFIHGQTLAQSSSLIDKQLSFGTGLNGKVLATTFHNNALYVGGEFTTADGSTLNYIARWDKDRWRPLLSGLSGPVYTMVSFQGKLYVGGDFNTAGGKTVNNIATWDGSRWDVMGSGFNDPVKAIAVHNNQIHVGGDFTYSGLNPRQRIAFWNGSSWEQVASTGPNGSVNMLLSFDDKLFVGGSFTTIGSLNVNSIASFNGAIWASLSEELEGPVNSLTAYQGSLIAATASSNPSSSALRRWTGTRWETMMQRIVGTVYSLTSLDETLIVGGNFFTVVDTDTIRNMTRLTNQQWVPLGNPDSTVHSSTLKDDVIYFGGSFESHDGMKRSFYSRHALTTPQRPIILSPSNNSTRVSIRPNLSWESKAAFGYRVQISNQQNFSTSEIDTILVDSNQLNLELKEGLTRYFVRVLGSNNIAESEWSEASSFTTLLRYPEQIEPPSGQNLASSTVVFRWSGLPQALSYRIQVSTSAEEDPDTSSLLVNQSGIPVEVTQFTYAGLLDDATYYWRISAEYNDGVVVVPTDWSRFVPFTVNLVPPSPIPLVPFDNVELDSSNVVFRWGTVPTASNYQFQLSTTTNFDVNLWEQSTTNDSLTITDLKASQIYYWRVRSQNISGSSQWSLVKSFKTKNVKPSKVNLIGPDDREKDIVLTPFLVWSRSIGSSRYQLELSNSGTFPVGSTAVYLVENDTTYQVPKLQQGLVYFWRVTGINEHQVLGETSVSRSFTTINAPTLTSAPSLISPVNNSDSLSSTVTLSWQAISGATKYRIQLSRDLDFMQLILDNKNVTASQLQVDNLLPSETYYWRVTAINQAGDGPWSSKWSFSTNVIIPAPPSLLLPSNASVKVSLPPVLHWNTVQGAESYQIQVSTQSNLTESTPILSSNSNSITITTATHRTPYYWRVRAVNKAGVSEWSAAWVFTTITNVAEQVTLVSPTDLARNIPQTILLQWAPLNQVRSYRLQLSETVNFSSNVVTDAQIDTTFFTQVRLKGGKNYYWRVAALNDAGQGPWSAVRSFLTIPSKPSPPVLVFPANSNQFIVKPDSLVWRVIGIVDTYRIQLSKNQEFEFDEDYLFDLDNITTSKLDFLALNISKLESNTTYYWRVRAQNTTGISEWSPVWSFKTNPSKPTKVQLIDPADKKLVDNIQNLIFKWAPAESALFYEIDISGSNQFIGDFLPIIRLTEQSYNIPTQTPPSPNKTYYWRVRAGNEFNAGDQFGDWSEVRTFLTKPNPPDSVKLTSPFSGIANARRKQVLRWETQSLVTKYVIEISTSPTFSSTIKRDSLSSNLDSLEVFFPNFNQKYYWRVQAENEGGKGKWSKPSDLTTFNYPGTISTSFSLSFPNTNQSSYRLVSIPGKVDVPIHITFEGLGKQGVDWNAFTFENGQLIEAKSGDRRFNFKPGNGFWMLSKKPWNISRQQDTSVDLTTDDAFRIELKPGWNLISNPFNIGVPWQSVITANKLNANRSLFFFTSLGWTPQTTLIPTQAYYFYNIENASYLDIPYPVEGLNLPKGGANPAKLVQPSDSQIQVHFLKEDVKIGSVKLILSDDQNVKNKPDREPAPPTHFSTNSITWLDTDPMLPQSEWYSITEYLDQSPISKKITVNVGESANYSLDVELFLEDNLIAHLWDTKNQRWLQKGDRGFEVFLQSGQHHFELFLGSDQQITKIIEETLPTQFELLSNYPNPFNPTTTLRFSLPEPNKVNMNIYDIMGRKVSTLISQRLEAGYHSIDWNASHLASGVYIVELVAGQQRRTQKIALIK